LRHLPELQKRGDRPGQRRWLARVVYSCWVDALRRRENHPTTSLNQLENYGREPAGRADDPAELCQREWEREALRIALAELRPKLGEVNYRIVEAHWFEGRSHPDIAAELCLSPHQVRCRHTWALKKLKVRLEAYLGKDGEVF
jgi:RNA polymerase sigma factor (sigma-70 family)